MILPRYLNKIGINAFAYCFQLRSIEFLSDNKYQENYSFLCCTKLIVISFPNANEVLIDFDSLVYIESKDLFSLFIQPKAKVF